MRKRAIVTGAGGFIGHHLVRFLKTQGYHVRAVDIVWTKWSFGIADEYITADLRFGDSARMAMASADELYVLAADVGGLGYMHGRDADLIYNNTLMNTHTFQAASPHNIGRLIFASSAVVYPDSIPMHSQHLEEWHAWQEPPQEGGYGMAKLHGEMLCQFYREQHGLSAIPVRLHNTYGPKGSWNDGREKAPAAICRKVATAVLDRKDSIEIWGDGEQRRSFLYIDDAVRGLCSLAKTSYCYPVNLGSDEIVSINEMAQMVIDHSGWHGEIEHVEGPVGVRARGSNNDLFENLTGLKHEVPLEYGIRKLYDWILREIEGGN